MLNLYVIKCLGSLPVCLTVHLSICLSVNIKYICPPIYNLAVFHLSICPVCHFICLPVHLSVHPLSILRSACPSFQMLICLFILLSSILLSDCPSLQMFVYLSVSPCPSVSQPIPPSIYLACQSAYLSRQAVCLNSLYSFLVNQIGQKCQFSVFNMIILSCFKIEILFMTKQIAHVL
jgi:hypothetical protein